jgi:hypothetical protein
MDRQKSAEGILRSIDRTEGPNMKYGVGTLNFDGEGDAGNRAGMPGYSSGRRGRNPHGPVAGASSFTVRKENSRPESVQLMEAVVERENMFRALRQVEGNKGSAGVDGVSVDSLTRTSRNQKGNSKGSRTELYPLQTAQQTKELDATWCS